LVPKYRKKTQSGLVMRRGPIAIIWYWVGRQTKEKP